MRLHHPVQHYLHSSFIHPSNSHIPAADRIAFSCLINCRGCRTNIFSLLINHVSLPQSRTVQPTRRAVRPPASRSTQSSSCPRAETQSLFTLVSPARPQGRPRCNFGGSRGRRCTSSAAGELPRGGGGRQHAASAVTSTV